MAKRLTRSQKADPNADKLDDLDDEQIDARPPEEHPDESTLRAAIAKRKYRSGDDCPFPKCEGTLRTLTMRPVKGVGRKKHVARLICNTCKEVVGG